MIYSVKGAANVTVGLRIQEARKAKGLTQKELAAELGLATGTIQQYELGKRQPRIEQLQAIGDVLGVSVPYLLGYEKIHEIIPGRLKLIEVDDPESKNYQYRIEAQDEEAYLSGLQILENAGVSVFENTPAGRIFAALTRLNDNGQAIAVERVEELTLIPSYQRASTAVPEGGGTNAIHKEENK